MPDFSPCPINTDAEVNQWLKVILRFNFCLDLSKWDFQLFNFCLDLSKWDFQFYEMDAPLNVLSVFVSRWPNLFCRKEFYVFEKLIVWSESSLYIYRLMFAGIQDLIWGWNTAMVGEKRARSCLLSQRFAVSRFLLFSLKDLLFFRCASISRN